MKKQVKTVNNINAPAEQVWAQLRTGEGVNKWLPIITACRVEGNRRYCETADGSLKETIISSDDATMTFRYSIEEQQLLPVTDIVGTMRVEAIDAQSCTLYWDVEFDIADEQMFPQVEGGIRQIYAAGAEGLGKLAA
ncbi:MAG: SRPBCC family protein [Bacteroidota bacterium]